jgi:hypothetical protein
VSEARLFWGWLVLALAWGAPAFATSFEDCQRVLSQFQGEVAGVAVIGDHPGERRAGLRSSLRGAVKAGKQSDIQATLDQLTAFQKQATAMQQRGELSNFDGQRMVNGVQAVAVCYERVRDGR